MKKILYSLLIALLALSFGCEEPDEVQYTVAGGFSAEQGTFTALDEDVQVNFSLANPDVTELTITHVSSVNVAAEDTVESKGELGTVSISDGSGSISFTRSELGLSSTAAIGSYASFQATANIKGNPTSSFSVTIGDPLQSLSAPSMIYHNDDTARIKYTYMRDGDNIDGITVEQKTGVNGTYSDLGLTLNTKADGDGMIMDSVGVVGSDYSIGDTLYYKFTATVGSYTVENVVSFPVVKMSYESSGSFQLTEDTTKSFNLVENAVVMDTAMYDSADVTSWQSNSDPLNIGITSYHNAMFVESTTAVYENNNKEEVWNAYSNGTPAASIQNLSKGDVIVYKTMRGSEEYYGILMVQDAWVSSSGNEYTIDIAYKNN